MPFSYRDLFLGGSTFCCCLPVRVGVIIMTILGMFFAGILSIVLWFEVSSTIDMTSGERAGFVIAGLVETFLFAASIFGFVGTVVRKQLFVQTYAYIIYFHFILNVGVAIFLLYEVTRFSSTATNKACHDTIKDPQAQEQCTNLLNIATGVYWALTTFVLVAEMYGAIIVTRYVNRLKGQKRAVRVSRMTDDAFKLLPTKGSGYSQLREIPIQPEIHVSPSNSEGGIYEEYDPYREINRAPSTSRQTHEYHGPAPPLEVGYGGGTWTHDEISAEEKSRLQRLDRESGIILDEPQIDEEEADRRRSEVKSSLGPPASKTDVDPLPQYSAASTTSPGHLP
ncbi:hypothetical protein BDQ12DRAFT_673536 [Crucibulum laeve]|uniref:Uncharacterized protein n=1 Tax=Crucibulum laeve TaxID=68775 RepID=A0A5C3MH93_9AGAR|nr:hypothetical protein BDQ12DRAFT_673536 [Crucibulum laeve]